MRTITLGALYICIFIALNAVYNDAMDTAPFPTDPLVPTIVEKPNKPDADATAISDAMKKKDIRAIIDILAARTSKQRLEIKKSYKTQFKTALSADIKAITTSRLKYLLSALLYPPQQYLARMVKFSLNIPKDTAYMQILCQIDGAQVQTIAEQYKMIFKADLTEELNAKMTIESGKTFMTQIVKNGAEGRPKGVVSNDNPPVPGFRVRCSIEKNPGLRDLFTNASFEKIHDYITNVQKKEDTSFYYTLKNECGDGEVKTAYLGIEQFAEKKYFYLADQLLVGIQGLPDVAVHDNPDRIIVSRSELDLKNILDAYKTSYRGVEVSTTLDLNFNDTDADYKYCLNKLMTGNA